MIFAEKLKAMRKQAGMSQEKLAEKLGVSRQAITKWETAGGIPDIDNMIAIAALFGVAIDQLILEEKSTRREKDFLYESVTAYDIDQSKHFDIKLGGARRVAVSGYEGEKMLVRLASNDQSSLASDFKIKIDDVKKRIDVDVIRQESVTEAAAKEEVYIFVRLPNRYIGKVELKANAQRVEVRSLACESIDLTVKSNTMVLDGVEGMTEIDCNQDMNIICPTLSGSIALNQVGATSRLCVPQGASFTAACKGIGTKISYEQNGQRTQAFDTPNAEIGIELNGIRSELVIYSAENAVEG